MSQLEELLSAMDLHQEKIHLLGLSMGGPIASAYAGAHPETVLSLTWVAPYVSPDGVVPRVASHYLGRMIPSVLGMVEGRRFDPEQSFRGSILKWSRCL